MILIGDPSRMSLPQRQEATELLEHNIQQVMREQGPIAAAAIKYLLRRRRNIEASNDSLLNALRDMTTTGQIIEVSRRSRIRRIDLYALPGETENPSNFPDFQESNHTDAYYTLLFRYQAIRQHPGLATMDESYLDDLYNPQAPDTGVFKTY